MIKYIFYCLPLICGLLFAEETKQEASSIDINKLSRAFGHQIITSIKEPGVPFIPEQVIIGMQEALKGSPSPLDDQLFQEQVAALQEKAFEEMAAKNLKEAEEFLSKNKSTANVIEIIPSQLQYKVTTPGSGELVKEHSTPLIHYTGTFADGTVFSTSKDGEPISLPLDQVIPGFGKGLVGAKEGESRILYIHPDLAYGASPQGELPPNKLLIFDIEILKADTPQETDEDMPEQEGIAQPHKE